MTSLNPFTYYSVCNEEGKSETPLLLSQDELLHVQVCLLRQFLYFLLFPSLPICKFWSRAHWKDFVSASCLKLQDFYIKKQIAMVTMPVNVQMNLLEALANGDPFVTVPLPSSQLGSGLSNAYNPW